MIPDLTRLFVSDTYFSDVSSKSHLPTPESHSLLANLALDLLGLGLFVPRKSKTAKQIDLLESKSH